MKLRTVKSLLLLILFFAWIGINIFRIFNLVFILLLVLLLFLAWTGINIYRRYQKK